MPEKPLTIATYAAGVSLAAITLIYVFGPTYLIDGDSSRSSNNGRKKGVVGLSNPANDCFINSVLQCLAGLGDLRVYLIRETHRRELDGPEVYGAWDEEKPNGKRVDPGTLDGLRKGIVTRALKEVLDSLNERPIYRKTVSAGAFVLALERAFRQRISRQQQDAQEFLQVVAERLSDEYHAGRNARRKARAMRDDVTAGVDGKEGEQQMKEEHEEDEGETDDEDDEEGFPLEGKLESQIECLSCRFRPKPSVSTFVTLTLHVPQQSSTTLSACFDGLLKTEYIDDFKCEKCRLEHAVELLARQLSRASTHHDRADIETHIRKLKQAIQDDPETPPTDVPLPDIRHAPKRRIARHARITSFPKIIAIHLSRSIFDPGSVSTKNSAKVSFPESLPLGGILDRKHYKLLGLVTHKGSHNSGHYESFRRQMVYPPYSTPNTFTKGAPSSLTAASPRIRPDSAGSTGRQTSGVDISGQEPSSKQQLPPPASSPSSFSSRPSTSSTGGGAVAVAAAAAAAAAAATTTSLSPSSLTAHPAPTSAPPPRPSTSPSIPSTPPNPTTNKPLSTTLSTTPSSTNNSPPPPRPPPPPPPPTSTTKLTQHHRQQRKPNKDRWWRISDDKVKESKTPDVLAMQREVYLLFYERQSPTSSSSLSSSSFSSYPAACAASAAAAADGNGDDDAGRQGKMMRRGGPKKKKKKKKRREEEEDSGEYEDDEAEEEAEEEEEELKR